MLAALEDRLEARAQGERTLARAGATTQGDDPDIGIEQEVQGDALLRAASVQAEGLAVTANEPHPLFPG